MWGGAAGKGASITYFVYLVYDTVNSGHNSGLSAVQIQQMISGLTAQENVNSIWGQVNISFSATVFTTTVTFDSSETDVTKSNNPDATALLSAVVYPINVFFVDKYSITSTDYGDTYSRSNCTGKAKIQPGYTVIPTHDIYGNNVPITQLAATLAHELGHQLGLKRTSTLGGINLNVDADLPNNDASLSYRLMEAAPNGLTVTPIERNCISAVALPAQ